MSKKKIIVLGAGMVGKAIAIELSNDYEVTCADINQDALENIAASNPVNIAVADLKVTAWLQKLIEPFDLVIGAVPGFMGFDVLKTVIESGKNVVDISFFNADPFLLDDLAKKHNVTAVVDCGVAPGLSNIFLGYHHSRMQVKKYECLVGGLPVKRIKPFEYKAPFSPIDVIEEYTRPARFIINNQLVIREALSDPELISFEQTGTLEAFNTDGLRTLIDTMKVPDMIERTLRYPGHIDLMRSLRETGFFSHDEITIGDKKVRPIDLTSTLLFRHWKLIEGEKEFTIMRVKISGAKNESPSEITYTLYDKYDEKTKTSSMARTTGYTCTAVARLVIENQFRYDGICPPEYIGADEAAFRFILNYLSSKNISITIE